MISLPGPSRRSHAQKPLRRLELPHASRNLGARERRMRVRGAAAPPDGHRQKYDIYVFFYCLMYGLIACCLVGLLVGWLVGWFDGWIGWMNKDPPLTDSEGPCSSDDGTLRVCATPHVS